MKLNFLLFEFLLFEFLLFRGRRASYLRQELVRIGGVPVQTPSQQEEQTLQSVVSLGVPEFLTQLLCRFPQWSSTAWRFLLSFQWLRWYPGESSQDYA